MSALIEEWLDQAGYRVTSCASVQPAPADRPHAILCSTVNLRGPGAMRLELLSSSYPRVPVVALSGQQAHSLASGSGKAGALGVSAVLAKPFTQAELLAAVSLALRSGQ